MENQQRKISALLIIGIVIAPIIFVWFTLRKGYSKKVRILSFGYLALGFILFAALPPAPPSKHIESKPSTEQATDQKKAESTASESKPSTEQATDQKKTESTASESKPSTEQTTDQKKAESTASESKPSTEQTTDQKKTESTASEPTTSTKQPEPVAEKKPSPVASTEDSQPMSDADRQKLSNEIQEDMRLHATTPDIDPNMKIHQVNINDDKAILKMVGLHVVDKEKGLDAKNSPMTQYWFHKSLSNNLEIDLSPNFIQVWWKFDEKDPKKVNEMFLLGQKVTRSLLGDADGPQFYLDLIQTKEEIQQVQLNNGIIVQKARCFNDLCRYEILRN